MKNWTNVDRRQFSHGMLTAFIPLLILASAYYIFANNQRIVQKNSIDGVDTPSSQASEVKGISIAHASDNVTISKTVDKIDVQRDDPAPGAQDVNYTITVTTGPCDPIPLDIAVVFDRSGSMTDIVPGSGTTRGQLAKQATTAFINQLESPKDHIALSTYGTTGSLNQRLTLNLTDIRNDVNNIVIPPRGNPQGNTNIYDGLRLANNEMDINRTGTLRRASARPIIVLFTDGVANEPTNIPGKTPRQLAIDEANRAKNNLGLRVITVALGESGQANDGVDGALLLEMASSPTDYYAVDDPLDLEDTFVLIAQEIQTTYANLVVSDNISDLLQYADLTSVPSNATFSNNMLTWDLGDVACETTIQLPFPTVVRNDAPDLSQMINQASVSVDQTMQLQSQSVTTTIHAPVLSVEKTDNQITVPAGSPLTYTISVANSGTGNAYEVEILDTVPEEFIVDTDTISHNGAYNPPIITWNNNGLGYIFDGSFAPTNSNVGSGELFTFSGLVNNNAPNGTITNTVVVRDNTTTVDDNDDTDIFTQQSSSSTSTSSSSTSTSSVSSSSSSSISSSSSESTQTSSSSSQTSSSSTSTFSSFSLTSSFSTTSSNMSTFSSTISTLSTIPSFSSLPTTGENLPETGIYDELSKNIWIKGLLTLFIGWLLLQIFNKLEFSQPYDMSERNVEFEKDVEKSHYSDQSIP